MFWARFVGSPARVAVVPLHVQMPVKIDGLPVAHATPICE